ncbi:hypothetical protein FGF66_10830 [Chlorobaculum thiosulfatiphilum]|uniref:Uncharacterized protein n=1 Tax=Chlorobaculum thiosulfatiphilum TaxID=115852 RepID=A0A5C4S1S7_CHLTI|nr:hypothetical protein [Chlorobaculum thiosulfatiphilum]TNJ37473.1 hypothetical protein FGF66_10830 [Chlorobaculum thiosulfatiphilum]
MRDHTPNFKLLELSRESKRLIRETVTQLLEKLAGDGQLTPEARLEFWVEIPGVRHPRGTFRGGCLMPDCYLCLSDWFATGATALEPAPEYHGTANPLDVAWNDLLDELYYQIEIFTAQATANQGVTVELWAGTRNRPECEWIYAVDKKVELP